MTSNQMFEYALIELNKVQAPSLLLEDYNYFINKAINQYINKIYRVPYCPYWCNWYTHWGDWCFRK